jgi:hypothetical protein
MGIMDATTSRRRSQRLYLQIRVNVEGKLAGNKTFSEETRTVVVNAHGALMELKAGVSQGQAVTLKNVRTGESTECVVKLVSPAEGGRFNIAIEFKTPSPDFWRISFPPDDWSPRNLDTK